MAEAAVTIRIVRRGTRAQELLADLFERLSEDPRETDDSGVVILRIAARGPQAWDRVRDALDEGGSDWRQWLHLEPRPRR
jgi:hypothetical protein